VGKPLNSEQLRGDLQHITVFLAALQKALPEHVPANLVEYLEHARDNELAGEALAQLLARASPPGR